MRTILATFAALAILPATQAAAEPVHFKVTIPFGDLDLTSQEGASALEERIDQIVRAACTEPFEGDEVEAFDADCLARTKAAAYEKLAEERGSTLAFLD